jgi:iron complex outermembrane recepter protein
MNSRSAEIQFISNTGTPFSDVLEWTAGIYYFESEAGFDPMYVGAYRFRAPGTAVNPFAAAFDAIDSLDLPVPEPYAAVTLVLNGILDTAALAEYLQVKWTPFDWMSLTLGGRYQQEHREVVDSRTGLALDGLNEEPQVPLFNFLDQGEFKADKEDFSPRVVMDFRLFDDELLYASWSQAFKSGTFNIVSVYTAPTYVQPEKTTAYELGLKGTLLDQSLRYSLALFRSQIDDLQTQFVSVLAGGLLELANAAEATIYGAELDLTWEMMPEWLPGFVVTASGGYLDGEYDSYPEGSGFDEETGLFFGPNAFAGGARDFSGHRTVRTPELSGSFGLSYSFDAPGGSAEIGADVYYNSGYFFDPQNVVEQPAYYTLNARASYLYAPWNLRVSLIGKNLTDEFYYYNQLANDFGVAATGGPPPSYAVTLSWAY